MRWVLSLVVICVAYAILRALVAALILALILALVLSAVFRPRETLILVVTVVLVSLATAFPLFCIGLAGIWLLLTWARRAPPHLSSPPEVNEIPLALKLLAAEDAQL